MVPVARRKRKIVSGIRDFKQSLRAPCLTASSLSALAFKNSLLGGKEKTHLPTSCLAVGRKHFG
jgi:hypothetical protein